MVWAILGLALTAVALALWAMRCMGKAKDAEVELAATAAERDRVVMDLALTKSALRTAADGYEAQRLLDEQTIAKLKKERDANETPSQRAARFNRAGAPVLPVVPVIRPTGGKR